MLQATLKSVYGKDNTAFLSQQDEEERQKLVQSLQDEIQQLTNERWVFDSTRLLMTLTGGALICCV